MREAGGPGHDAGNSCSDNADPDGVSARFYVNVLLLCFSLFFSIFFHFPSLSFLSSTQPLSLFTFSLSLSIDRERKKGIINKFQVGLDS